MFVTAKGESVDRLNYDGPSRINLGRAVEG